MGPVIDRIRREAGLQPSVISNEKKRKRTHRRRRKRHNMNERHSIQEPRLEKVRVRSQRVRSALGYNSEAIDLERGPGNLDRI